MSPVANIHAARVHQCRREDSVYAMYQLKQNCSCKNCSCKNCTVDVGVLCGLSPGMQHAEWIVAESASMCTCLATICREEFVLSLVMLQVVWGNNQPIDSICMHLLCWNLTSSIVCLLGLHGLGVLRQTPTNLQNKQCCFCESLATQIWCRC